METAVMEPLEELEALEVMEAGETLPPIPDTAGERLYPLADKNFDFDSLTYNDFDGTMLYAAYFELDEFKREVIKGKLVESGKRVGVSFLKLWKIREKELKGEWNIVGDALPVFTLEALAEELPGLNIEPVWDEIAATIRYETTDRYERVTVPTFIYSALCGSYRGVNPRIIKDYLTNIALTHQVNPVTEHLNRYKWDGTDRLPELYRILGIDNDPLSQTLVLKWFWQGRALLLNGRGGSATFGADGILVLTGAQGIGKTSFFRWAAIKGEWFRDGCTLSKDKDEERRIVTCWIAELGEIGRTLRGDLDSLKAFVTRDFDRYRLPYAAADTENPRHTNLCGTVNGEDGFLIDPTGNRRFWTVPVETIDLPALNRLSATQVWAQIDEQYAAKDRQGFRLTRDEREALDMRNAEHMKKAKGHEEVEDLICTGTAFDWMTVGEWKEKEPNLRNLSSKTVGDVLQRLKVKQISCRKGVDGVMKRGRFYWLPCEYRIAPKS